jgi:hypothetical protein
MKNTVQAIEIADRRVKLIDRYSVNGGIVKANPRPSSAPVHFFAILHLIIRASVALFMPYYY